MALRGITRLDEIEYVSNTDPAKVTRQVPVDPKDPKKGKRTEVEIQEGATVFLLRPLDVFLMGRIYDRAQTVGNREDGSVSVETHINSTNIDAVRYGLAGWRHFLDEDGNEIEFDTKRVYTNGRKYQVASDECISRLGIQLISELAGEIKKISEVSKDEEKNYDAA